MLLNRPAPRGSYKRFNLAIENMEMFKYEQTVWLDRREKKNSTNFSRGKIKRVFFDNFHDRRKVLVLVYCLRLEVNYLLI